MLFSRIIDRNSHFWKNEDILNEKIKEFDV